MRKKKMLGCTFLVCYASVSVTYDMRQENLMYTDTASLFLYRTLLCRSKNINIVLVKKGFMGNLQ